MHGKACLGAHLAVMSTIGLPVVGVHGCVVCRLLYVLARMGKAWVTLPCCGVSTTTLGNLWTVVRPRVAAWLTIKTNVIGTLNMLGLAKRVGARILLTSTSEVYGDPLVHPQPETYWGNVNPIEIRIARIFNTYGPRMNIDDGRVVSNFIAQAIRGEPLTVQAPGTQTRSFCYVSDMVDGLIRLMEGENTGPINIGNPGEFTILELAETVKELINPDVEIKMVENTPDDP
ncbi:UDP-XYL synthase 5 [Actinidia rufa]|uniref:UDP-glucuronate decarboxylase n=1 Tax=Actinidia rufa TaxID=165716 RepID=A0A7J0DLH0_9ERIC|nr:UDP-XYL synthase 5 [Actinidia rufa]